MSVIPVDINAVKLNVQNDAQEWERIIQWAKRRYQAYAQNLDTTTMTALGIATNDQNFINAFVADLNRFNQLASGTLPSDADDMIYVVHGLLGVF
jgi:hypothetical protein